MRDPGTADGPLRVIHVVHGLTLGGAEVDLSRKIRWAIRHRDHRPTVVCLMRRGVMAPDFEEAGVPVLGPLMRGRYDVSAARSLLGILRDGRWDLVHTHLFEASLVLWLATLPAHRALRAPWIASEHSMAEAWGAAALRLDGRFLRTARCLTVPTEAARESFAGRGLPRAALRILPNAVDVDRLEALDRDTLRKQVRAELGVADNDFLVGTICRLHPVKALDTLIAAASDLPVRLVIAGEGRERERLAAQIDARGARKRMCLLGPRSDAERLLAGFDIFCLPSRSESFGLAAAEAMLMGTPVVASRTGGIPELAGDGRYAVLVPPHDPQALRDALVWAMENRGEHRSMTLAGREYVRARWSVPVAAEAMDRLYREFIRPGTGPAPGR